MGKYGLLILIVGLLTLSLPVYTTGQESAEDLFKLNLEEFLNIDVVSVSKRLEKSFTAQGTVYVITEEDINRYRYRSLQEALKYVPSVYLYNPQSWIWGGQRGFVSNFSQTLLLINGREVNNLIAGEGFISHQFGTKNIKRIEVVASPASALYGANALAGVINVITKDADPQFEKVELSVDAGSHNTAEGNIVFGKSIKDISLKGSIRFYRSDEDNFLNFVTGPDYSTGWVDNERANPFITEYKNESEAFNINLQIDFKGFYAGANHYTNQQSHGLEKLRWDYTDGFDEREFTLLYTGYDDEVVEDTRLKVEYQYIRSYLWGSYDAGLWPVARLQAPGNLNIYALPDTVTTSTGRILQGDDEIKAHYENFAAYLIDQDIIDENDITPEEIETYFRHIYTNKDGNGNQRHRFDIMVSRELNQNVSIDIGYAYDYINIAGLAVTDAGVGNGASYDIPLDSSKKGDVYESYKHGVFGQLYYTVIEDILWLNLGARYDDQDHYGSTFNPRGGLVWQPTESNTIKLLYGEAFREPNIFELSSNSNLEPAELKSYEISAAHSFDQNIRFSLTGYHSKIDNFLGSVGSLIGEGVGQVETQTVQGIECQFDIRKGPVTAFINGAYILNAEQEVTHPDTGEKTTVDLLGLPEEKANIGVSYHFLKYYTISLISSHIAAYDALSGDSSESKPFKIKTYHDMKLSLGIADVRFAGIVWDGFVTVNNLADRKNYEANIRRSGTRVFQQERRNVMAGLRIAF